MDSEIGRITELALNAVRNEELSFVDYPKVEDIIEYLMDDSHFKKLSDLLTETMQQALDSTEGWDQQDFIDELYSRLKKQDDSCGRIRKNAKQRRKNKLKLWFTGETKTIRYRADVLEICFALQLNEDLSTTLLNKCGHNGFNPRNVEDVIYHYCILNKRPLSAAKRIILDYQKYTSDAVPTNEVQNDDSHSGQTTILLMKELSENSKWSSDKEFLEKHLIPRKAKFIGYSSTAIKEYYILKNNLFAVVFLDAVEDEERLAFDRRDDNEHNKYDRSENSIKQTDISVSLAVRSTLQKRKNNHSIIDFSNKIINSRTSCTYEILSQFQEAISENLSCDARIMIENYLYSVLHIANQIIDECIRKAKRTILNVQNITLDGPISDSHKQILGLLYSVNRIVNQMPKENANNSKEENYTIQSVIDKMSQAKEALSKIQIIIRETPERKSQIEISKTLDPILKKAYQALNNIEQLSKAKKALSKVQNIIREMPECNSQIQISEILDPILKKAYQDLILNTDSIQPVISAIQRGIKNSRYIKSQLQRAISNNTVSHLIYYNTNNIDCIMSTVSELQQIINIYPNIDCIIQKAFVLGSTLTIAIRNMDNDICKTKDVLREIQRISNENLDIYTQKQISSFLNDIMKIGWVLRYAIYSIQGADGQYRKNSESILKDTVMKDFPRDDSFTDYEKDPTTINQGMAIRKAIILLYYIAYAYELKPYIRTLSSQVIDDAYTSERFDELGFDSFMDELNTILSKCNLPLLYPADRFDWLILYSIRTLDTYDMYEDLGSPLKPFNDVISYSFGDSPDDDD